MANGKKTLGDRYATMMIGVFCTLGSGVYIRELTLHAFEHKAQVVALQTQVKENTAQTAVATKTADTAKEQATTAVRVAKEAQRTDPVLEWRRETDRRQQQDRRDINKIMKRLGML